ncbi:outer membrane protein, partial [Devosia pacifica]
MKYAIPTLIGCALVLSAPAQAADLGWGGAPASTPVYDPMPVSNWTGFYVGATGGYGWGTLSTTPAAGGPTTEENTGGWQIGAEAGYNMDFGGFVLGAEGDLQWTDLGYSQDLGAIGELNAKLDGYGTARLRAGATFGQVMPFVTGGVAVARGTASITDPAGVTTSQSNTHVGWVVGGGLEAMAAENITLKAEYLYHDVGSQTYTTIPGGSVDAGHNFGVVRAGI